MALRDMLKKVERYPGIMPLPPVCWPLRKPGPASDLLFRCVRLAVVTDVAATVVYAIWAPQRQMWWGDDPFYRRRKNRGMAISAAARLHHSFRVGRGLALGE